MGQVSRPGRTLTCKEALQLLLDQVDFTAGACSLTDMVGQCVPKGVFEQCRAAIAAASEKPATKGLRLTKLERDMVLRALGFVDAGEWPWEPIKKAESKAFNSAWKKIQEDEDAAER